MSKKKYRWLLLAVLIVAALSVLWGKYWKKGTPEYIFLMNGTRNYEDYSMFQSFEEEIERLGGRARVLDFEESQYSTIRQAESLKKTVNKNTVCILVSGASSSNLTEALQEYSGQGIKVLSCISAVSAKSRFLHLGTADLTKLGADLYAETVKACEEQGRFVIISGYSQSEYMNTLLMNIRYAYEKREYPQMRMVDLLYEEGIWEEAAEEIGEFLENNEEVGALLCLSESAVQGACAAVAELGLEGSVDVVGLATPAYLSEYLESQTMGLEVFFCDMTAFGAWTAQIAYKAVTGEIDGTAGEHIRVFGQTYEIQTDQTPDEEEPGTALYMYSAYEKKSSVSFR